MPVLLNGRTFEASLTRVLLRGGYMFGNSTLRITWTLAISLVLSCSISSYGDWDIYTVDDGNTAVSMDMDSSNTMHLWLFRAGG